MEYSYENLVNSKYTSYDRHLIWRHKYLDVPLTSYQKKDRKMIEEYLKEEEHNKKISTYNEGIYKKPISNITEYNKQEENEIQIVEDLKSTNNNVRVDTNVDHDIKKEQEQNIKSQILNINN